VSARQLAMEPPAATEAAAAPAARQRTALSGAWLLSGATLVSGVLAYAFHILAARALGADGYGRIAVLWGAMFLVAIVLFRPVEQTASRAIANRVARGWEARSVVTSALLVAAGCLALATVVILACWAPITDGLFDGDGTLTALLLAGVAGYGVSYVARGLLGGVRWFAGYGLNLIADGAARLIVAIPLVVVASTGLAGTAMVVAGLAGAAIPLWVGRRQLSRLLAHGSGERFRASSMVAFAAPAAVIAGADQILVNASPILVVLAGGTAAAAGVVFAATMLVRIPVYVFQGVAASILPNLTRLHANDDDPGFRAAVRKAVAVLAGASAVMAVGAFVIGPWAMRLVYGADFSADRAELGLLAVGVGFYLAASTISQALLAQDRGLAAAVAWAAAAVLFVALFLVLPGTELMRIAASFALAMGVGAALVGGALLSTRPTPPVPGDGPVLA
jgi:O-antigen/teichoic acid export membrane protein